MTEKEFDKFRHDILMEAQNVCIELGEYSIVSENEDERVIRFTDKAEEYIAKVTSHCDRLSNLLYLGDYSVKQYC